VNELAHIPTPSEATWVDEWHFFEGSCGHQYWIRHFEGSRWTVETSGPDPIDIDHAGCQLEDGSAERWILLDGALDLNADSRRTGTHPRRQPMSKHHVRNPIKWHGDLPPDRFTIHAGWQSGHAYGQEPCAVSTEPRLRTDCTVSLAILQSSR
jgi:hypothetical protein